MNLFEAVKDAVPTKMAVQHYGIEVRRNGMACCPFHDDKTPSMKVDKRFHCFGCQEDGDVIDFVGKLFGLTPKMAAEKLAEDFGVAYDNLKSWDTRKRPSVISKLAAAQEYRKRESRCYRIFAGYFQLLGEWKERYAPQPTDEDWHPLFMEALQKTDYIEYLLDTLTYGSLDERAAIVKEKSKELDALEKRISDFTGREKTALFSSGQQRKAATVELRGTRCPDELAM